MESFSNNILLSNLVKIRWIAIIGQLFAIIFVYYYLNISIPLITCLFIVSISGLINLSSFYSNKINDYLSDKEAFYFLLYDTTQLCILLYLTGGIYNPFSLLLIAPLIITASYLPIMYSVALLFLSILYVILISNYYVPIFWEDVFEVPSLFTYGLSFALIISLIFIAVYVYYFASTSRDISQALSQTKSALANQKKISEIGSLSAAAAHELSTPLNTIFLILNDLNEYEVINKNKEIKKEIELLKSQAERCKKILLTLSKNPENLKDSFLDKTTISSIVKINFDKFNNKNISLKIKLLSQKNEPTILYKDEILYCIGNIIQNAIQHANSRVISEISWDKSNFFLSIRDDGNGFKKEIIDQIGKPYISKKGSGMGLGIFIAKNLIENIGGSISFTNTDNSGGNVEIIIKRDS